MTILTPKCFTIEEYHRLAKLGFLTEDDRVELIRGEIIQMAAKGTAHINCCRNLLKQLPILLVGIAELQCQDPIVLPSNSEPEPDFAILRIRHDNYRDALPNSSDVLFVIEIADSTLKKDKEVKTSLYAEAGISDYWIFNLVDNHLEAYSEPYQNLLGRFGYALKRIILPNQTVALPGFPDLLLDLSKVFL
ncbi:Uma2 family endonuclease [Argonema antarcticum]|uniref:Uma2 family endonuclease n=1 Tax=Argonema antarcticum TaxID=2942763 RepID=UPI00201168C0|nr:Uma2 family endonuclease [Argonema antarcticum]MCL1470319.1 Uma2 family endonuclease [Argonema antarcticum A004/B2]